MATEEILSSGGDGNNNNRSLQEKLLPVPPPPTPNNDTIVQTVRFDSDDDDDDDDYWSGGEAQPNRFRDVPFAVLFFVQLATVLGLAFAWGIPSLSDAKDAYHHHTNATNDDDDETDDESGFYYGFLYFCLCSSALSLGISSLGLYVMTIPWVSRRLIECCLVSCLIVSMVCGTVAASQGYLAVSLYFLIVFVFGLCYTCCVWSRIPFASANLSTAVAAIKANWGVYTIAFAGIIKTVLWSLLWILAMIGMYIHTLDCSSSSSSSSNNGQQQEEECKSGMNNFVIGLFLLSFYWTNQVLKNIVHVTVAGVVGTWWFDPVEAASCCSASVRDSFARSTTYSFGSICLGSLLVALIQVLRQLIHQLRAENSRQGGGGGGGGLLLCLLECIVGYLQDVLEYFNKWAYIYVGLYGYDYMSAGKNVVGLFRYRGWTAIINDGLVHRSLLMISLLISGITGCLGLGLAKLQPSWIESLGGGGSGTSDGSSEGAVLFIAFFVPFIIGASMSSVLMSVIASAVDTVVVCFAEAPDVFHTNYPFLSQSMRDAWTKIYPDEFGGFTTVPTVTMTDNNRGEEQEGPQNVV